MIELFVIVAVIAYLAFHGGHGHANYRHAKAHGLSPNLYWSLARGPYGSIRVPGTGFRVSHRL